MKRINYITTLIVMVALLLTGCYKETAPKAAWEYPGLIPEIANGPSNAQKLCYELYQKYDLHVYYNLAGVNLDWQSRRGTVRTDAGWLQTNSITAAAIPIQPADEASAERFLTMLKAFFSLLPDDKVFPLGIHRRIVLAKINPGAGYHATLKDEDGNPLHICSYVEDQQGIILYGYLRNNDDTNNTLFSDFNIWKWNICYRYFLGSISATYKRDFTMPVEFINVSSALYSSTTFNTNPYNHVVAKECGFVHPYGGTARTAAQTTVLPNADWASYVAWIITRPYSLRITDIEANPRIKEKYGIVMNYYKTNHNMDLEAISVKYCAFVL